MAKGAKLKQDEHFPDYTVGAIYVYDYYVPVQ